MRPHPSLTIIILAVLLGLAIPLSAQAEVVGQLTMVEGGVSRLKGGKLPAQPVKVGDGVEPGDVLRTKSASKAQITFMDNSTMTLAPESRVVIEAYMFDPAQKKRHAVFQLFRGLAYVVVNKVFAVQDPDFVIKTHTAVMGVRGTEFGIRLHPASSTILNFKGLLEVGNFSPEASGLSRKAFTLALASGTGKITWINSVLLHDMQGATVTKDLPPAIFDVTSEHKKSFMNQLASGTLGSKPKSGSPFTTPSGTADPGSSGTGPTGIGTLPAEVTPGATGSTATGMQLQIITSGMISPPVSKNETVNSPPSAPPVSDFQAHHPHLKR